jgi:phosphatidylinositol-3-phosphatase
MAKRPYTMLGLGLVIGSGVIALSLINTSMSPVRADTPCGTSASPPADGYKHVVEIIEENQSYSKIIGAPGSRAAKLAPYINSLASQCGLATDYHSIMHPSLPDYLALTAGDTFGVTRDIPPTSSPAPLDAVSTFDQTTTTSLMESMPEPCYETDAFPYLVHHNPQPYFADQQSACRSNNLPLGNTPDLSAAFTLIVPNRCNDMHGGAGCPAGNLIKVGDVWLQNFMQKIYATPEWSAGNTVIFITWDEGNKKLGTPEDNHVASIVVAPSVVPGTQDATTWTHYSLLDTVEGLLGQPCLAKACGAGDMSTTFNLK